jgi:hypothetical protein
MFINTLCSASVDKATVGGKDQAIFKRFRIYQDATEGKYCRYFCGLQNLIFKRICLVRNGVKYLYERRRI